MTSMNDSPTTHSKIEAIANFILSASLFVFLLLSVSYHGSYKASGILILCTYLLFFLPSIRKNIQLDKTHAAFAISCVAYIVSILMEVLIHNESARELDPASKAILFAPFLILLSTLKPKNIMIAVGFSLGSITLFSVALYERNVLGIDRVGAGINPIQFGNISSVMGLLCFFLIKTISTKNHRLLIPLLIAGGVAGISASFLSLSRGGWLIIPIAIAILTFQYRQNIKASPKAAIVGILITFSTMALLISETNIVNRLQTANTDIQEISQGNNSSSTGQRIEMWKVAFDVFLQNPALGVGKSSYLQQQQEKIERKEVSSALKGYNQAHNAYLDAAARRGIIGVSALLLLLLTPFTIAWKHLQNDNPKVKAYAYSLVILSLSFLSFNLTQSMFNHNSGIVMFLMFFIILMSGLNAEKKAHDFNHNHY